MPLHFHSCCLSPISVPSHLFEAKRAQNPSKKAVQCLKAPRLYSEDRRMNEEARWCVRSYSWCGSQVSVCTRHVVDTSLGKVHLRQTCYEKLRIFIRFCELLIFPRKNLQHLNLLYKVLQREGRGQSQPARLLGRSTEVQLLSEQRH